MPVATEHADDSTSAPTADPSRSRRIDVALLTGEVLLLSTAAIVGAVLKAHGVPVLASAAPFAATWVPHIGPGSALAIAVAVTVIILHERVLAWSWRTLLAYAYGASLLWIGGLALIDGWQRGIASRLATPDEFVHDVPRVHGIRALLATFSDHILSTTPDYWTTHVAGHPPGALLVFVALDRIGLGGGAAAGVCCILVGALAAPCVAVTMRALGYESQARRAVAFLVLFPGAVWVGTSADGMFMGVAAAGVALVAVGGWRRNLAGGLLLGYTLYLSYGLALFGLVVLVVVWRRPVKLVWAALGATVVVVVFTAGGFWWPTGYHLVIQRYYAGYGGLRPYGYWVWANLACLVACAGPVVAPALLRAGVARMWLPLAAATAIVCADLSGLSKAETERIWLPYAIWLLPAASLLPATHRRWWLTLQAATALLVNHLLLTHW
jgi:methylthioxylose transferase